MSRLVYRLPEDSNELAQRLAPQRKLFDRGVLQGVYGIFNQVEEGKDQAIIGVTESIDKVKLERVGLTPAYIRQCLDSLSPTLKQAIEQARDHIEEVNRALLPVSWHKEIRPGTIVGEKISPLDAVGIWIPARKGPLISTALMLVTAAKTAGVGRIVVGMPPLPSGLGDPATVAAASMAGADEFVTGNGVAVIAGLCMGTPSIPKVNGIFGPGPGGIAAAMSTASSYGVKTAVGLGPTECVIVADETADAEMLAYDLINEGEHGPDSSSILVTTSAAVAERVERHLFAVIDEVEPPRRDYLHNVFGANGLGAIVVAPNIEAACEFVNEYAPEHVMVVCGEETERKALELIRNAGEILIGPYTPFSAANYGIGITAVLPTNGYAKSFSGITSKEMIKTSTIGKLDQQALAGLLPVIEALGGYERLPCHVKAAEVRLRRM
ncbi:histidinol dehydrogenase [Paenibacillus mesophilus]|uniref:histidinol dehydrogenase n=1 Tax=Paenibacillus mesophilus TaxID=2582849 RepID=UPI00110D6E97|nr:histidinol dehydrogenase [Paenibacillus mesophilus]TMV52862.1 histidinol dehydrogenase [Paenibacillus mesophilus]